MRSFMSDFVSTGVLCAWEPEALHYCKFHSQKKTPCLSLENDRGAFNFSGSLLSVFITSNGKFYTVKNLELCGKSMGKPGLLHLVVSM